MMIFNYKKESLYLKDYFILLNCPFSFICIGKNVINYGSGKK